MRLSRELRCELYRRMLRIRHFELAAIKEIREGNIPGVCHSSIGQEGVIAGSCLALSNEDKMTGNHRSHGHPIGKGAALKPLMAELMGKVTGVCQGRGGSMHLADISVGSIGESAIVGGGIPLAVGAALTAKVRKSSGVSLCFFGDGASNEGVFAESINMAAIWKLPVIFLCENNGYALTTPQMKSHAQPDIAKRAEAYDMPGVIVDGQNAEAVYEATCEAVERARRGEGPTLIEAKTYRFDEHSIDLSIQMPYRESSEIEFWTKERDPIEIHKASLLRDGLDEETLAAIEQEVLNEVAEAVSYARESPFPERSSVFDNLYSRPQNPQAILETDERKDVPTARLSYMQAIVEAQREEMQRDEGVILIGQDISCYGGTKLFQSFDETRLWNTPISEAAQAGMGIGAALTGLRPIVDLTIANFVYLASDQIINQAAKLHYMTAGQLKVPVVFRLSMYYNISMAAQHSDRPYPLFLNVPGLKIVIPSSPAEMKGLMKSAIRDDNPVLVFEDCNLWSVRENVSKDPDFLIPIGKAAIKRPGTDLTLVAIGAAVRTALSAAEELAGEGISAEVVDPRSIAPMDKETLIRSIAKTGRCIIVENANRTGGVGAEIAAVLCEEAFESLKKPIQRIATPDVHIPFSPILEKALYPTKDGIIAAARRIL